MGRTRERFLGFAAAAILLLVLGPAPAASVGPAGPSSADAGPAAGWIVTLRAGIDAGVRGPDLARAAGGTAGSVFRHALNGFVFEGSVAAAAALARQRDVRTVVADQPLHAVAETTPPGIRRIDASDPTQPDAHDAGFTGAGARIAILDTGVDLDHPDLVANLDTSLGLNCMTGGSPQDDHGHGTHVAGIAAAVEGNATGVVGVASGARIVPIKVLDSTGYGEWSNLICGVDYLTGLIQDGDPSNDVRVANMSLGDVGAVGSCHDGGIREAICTSVAAGITYVAAAGNSTVDTATFIPAAFPEVTAVSAMVDLDGEPGGLAGCSFFGIYCDDTLAFFSNYGAVVDVTAPGAQVYSTWNGGGYQTSDGTSMASPHVAGVAALVLAARPSLAPADVQDLLKETGECPNGQWADAGATADCAGQGQWGNDPDGQAESLVNALRAANAAAGWDARPTVAVTAPADGASAAGVVNVVATASDDIGVAAVEFSVNGTPFASDTNGADGWSASWDTATVEGGAYTLSATAIDGAGHRATDGVTVWVGSNLGGGWVGAYGQDGYALFAWNGTSDLVLLPGATLTLDEGLRDSQGATTDARALEGPDEAERRAAAYYDDVQVGLHLTFASAYTGRLHLYALDWATSDRRERFTVDDGSGAQIVELSTSFHDGAWMHFPISVGAGGTVTITVDRLAGANALINGLFLGEGPPATPAAPSAPQDLAAIAGSANVTLSWDAPLADGGSAVTGYKVYRGTSPGIASLLATLGNVLAHTDATATNGTTYYYSVSAVNGVGEGGRSGERTATLVDQPGAQGDWVGAYGDDGYALLAWNGASDLVVLPQASVTLDQGLRDSQGATTDIRALESPDEAERRATAFYDANQVRLHLTFASAYSGSLHLYAVDWATFERRQRFIVDDGSGAQIVELSTSFHDGAWMHFPILVGAGGTVDITVDRLAGANALINGLFLGEGPAEPPPSTVPDAPTLVSATAGNAQVALSWTAPASDGGSPITAYTATASPGGATCSTAGATSCTVIGLTNGTNYSFSATATNAVGTGPPSNALSVTPATVPDAPTLDTATAGDAQVSLSWSAPGSDGGSAISGYTATSSPGGATCSTAGATSCTVTGLTNGTTYAFTVTATNAVGTGPASNSLSATPAAPVTAPDAPTLVSATAGNAQVALSWTAPASDGGSPITAYTATASPGGATCSTAGATSCTVIGLTNGTNYSFSVTATNAVGTGPPSNALSATPATVPGTPQNLAASPHKAKGVNLSWSPPTTNGGSSITGYRIYRGTTSGSWTLLASVGNVTTYRDAATKKNVRYYYVIRAINAVGEGASSTEATAIAK